jgi:hypothetical protein
MATIDAIDKIAAYEHFMKPSPADSTSRLLSYGAGKEK